MLYLRLLHAFDLLFIGPCFQVRAHVEAQIGLIADGKAQKEAVVAHTLEQFRAKFLFFVGHITRMDSLFEASFSPLSSSGGCRSCVWRRPSTWQRFASTQQWQRCNAGGVLLLQLDKRSMLFSTCRLSPPAVATATICAGHHHRGPLRQDRGLAGSLQSKWVMTAGYGIMNVRLKRQMPASQTMGVLHQNPCGICCLTH
jgi:hypothetical protein